MSEAAEIYAKALRAQLPRLLSLLDREPESISAGSFDREHWGWKFRDFPVTMLQYGLLPLAQVWRDGTGGGPDDPWRGSDRLRSWIIAGLEQTLSRQRGNGAFDSIAPNTFDHGVTLAMAFVVCEVKRMLADALPASLAERVCEAARSASAFAGHSDEDYAFISNHQALFALAHLTIEEATAEPSERAACDRVLGEIYAHQSADGAYEEYGGPDPGYETLGIFYLAKVWRRTRSPELLASLERSVEFLSHFAHPDGSLGGVYGSRHTQLYFPGGLEILAASCKPAAVLACFLRTRLALGNLVTPGCVDSENLPTLLHAYASARRAVSARDPRHDPTGPLPCEALEGQIDFPASGLHAIGRGRTYAIVSSAKGGVCRVFDRRTRRLVYEDAGYLARVAGALWTSQSLGAGAALPGPRGGDLSVRTRFSRARQILPSATSFLALRALNLTLFRSLRLGAWLRRRVIARLITASPAAPLQLERSFRFADGEVEIRDRLEARQGDVAKLEGLVLPRAYTSIHMGSARYFHPAELGVTPTVDTDTQGEELRRSGRTEVCFRVRFSSELADSDGLADEQPAARIEALEPCGQFASAREDDP